jgi:hypothetical protein
MAPAATEISLLTAPPFHRMLSRISSPFPAFLGHLWQEFSLVRKIAGAHPNFIHSTILIHGGSSQVV